MRTIAVVIGFFALSGCAQYEAQRQAEAIAQAQAIDSNDDSRCQSYGAPRGSQNYVQCRMNLDNQHAQERQQSIAIANQNLARMQAATQAPPTYNVNVCNTAPGQVNTCIYH
jgi:hypothetical protein